MSPWHEQPDPAGPGIGLGDVLATLKAQARHFGNTFRLHQVKRFRLDTVRLVDTGRDEGDQVIEVACATAPDHTGSPSVWCVNTWGRRGLIVTHKPSGCMSAKLSSWSAIDMAYLLGDELPSFAKGFEFGGSVLNLRGAKGLDRAQRVADAYTRDERNFAAQRVERVRVWEERVYGVDEGDLLAELDHVLTPPPGVDPTPWLFAEPEPPGPLYPIGITSAERAERKPLGVAPARFGWSGYEP